MANPEWRHPVGAEPGWLMSDGRMIGEWYPTSGALLLYIGRWPNETEAHSVLEIFARAQEVNNE